MEQDKIPKSVYITLIIAIIVLAAGYCLWSSTHNNNEETDAIPADTSAPTATDSAFATPSATPSVIISTSTLPQKNLMHTVTIETNKGTIVFETYDADAPKAAKNFIDLANKGFYNGVIFHRVIPGFMIQGGDPTGTGMGGPGYTFADELNPSTKSYQNGYKRGTVAMANAGPNTNGSQFFIMHADYALPHNYTIFGKVIKGLDVVDAIASTATDQSDKPLTKIVMTKVTVAENK